MWLSPTKGWFAAVQFRFDSGSSNDGPDADKRQVSIQGSSGYQPSAEFAKSTLPKTVPLFALIFLDITTGLL